MTNISLEILNYSYWEHYSYAKDLSFVLPADHPKRIRIQKETDEILKQIHKLKK